MNLRARAAVVLGLVLAMLWPAGPALAAPTITEFPAFTKDRGPSGIAAGPDGDVWFAENAGPGGIGRGAPSGAMTEFTEGISGPAQGIALGADNNLWFTETNSERIGRITPSGTVTEFSLPKGSKPNEITAGPDGNLWFTETANPGRIGRITTEGAITEFASGLTANSQPQGITTGPDGNLWFTETANPGRIGRITTEGAITEFASGLTANSQPQGITTGPDGNLWFTETANPGRIGRITITGVVSEFSAGLTANSQPEAITAGSDGNLYFSEKAASKIGQITPNGEISEFSTPTAGSQPQGITTGPNGNIWFTEFANPGRIATMTVAPSVGAMGTSIVDQQSAILKAAVGPNSQATSYHFEYGPTAAYGSQTPVSAAGSGATPVTVSAAVTGLSNSTPYHFRAVATNAAGTTYGSDQTFVTATAPGPSLQPSPLALTTTFAGVTKSALAPPAALSPSLGRTAVVRVLSGNVLIRVPGSHLARPLGGEHDVPLGSLLVADRGTVSLTTAVDQQGHVQSATIWGGTFKPSQTIARHGLTTLTLAGGRLARCHRKAAAKGRTAAAAASRPRRAIRSLWAKDSHGRFSTRGQNSVATVRGTYWGTVDRCDGTLTIVRSGAVSVRRIRGHGAVLVRAGRSYLARR